MNNIFNHVNSHTQFNTNSQKVFFPLNVDDIPGAKARPLYISKKVDHYMEPVVPAKNDESWGYTPSIISNEIYHMQMKQLQSKPSYQGKKHFNAHHESEIKKTEALKTAEQIDPKVQNHRFPRNLAASDIDGAQPGSLISKVVKNYELAQKYKKNNNNNEMEDALDHFQKSYDEAVINNKSSLRSVSMNPIHIKQYQSDTERANYHNQHISKSQLELNNDRKRPISKEQVIQTESKEQNDKEKLLENSNQPRGLSLPSNMINLIQNTQQPNPNSMDLNTRVHYQQPPNNPNGMNLNTRVHYQQPPNNLNGIDFDTRVHYQQPPNAHQFNKNHFQNNIVHTNDTNLSNPIYSLSPNIHYNKDIKKKDAYAQMKPYSNPFHKHSTDIKNINFSNNDLLKQQKLLDHNFEIIRRQKGFNIINNEANYRSYDVLARPQYDLENLQRGNLLNDLNTRNGIDSQQFHGINNNSNNNLLSNQIQLNPAIEQEILNNQYLENHYAGKLNDWAKINSQDNHGIANNHMNGPIK